MWQVDDVAPHVPHSELLLAAKAEGLLRLGRWEERVAATGWRPCIPMQPSAQSRGEGLERLLWMFSLPLCSPGLLPAPADSAPCLFSYDGCLLAVQAGEGSRVL